MDKGAKRDPSRDAGAALLRRRSDMGASYISQMQTPHSPAQIKAGLALPQTGVIFIREPSICFCIYTQRQPGARVARGPVIMMYHHA